MRFAPAVGGKDAATDLRHVVDDLINGFKIILRNRTDRSHPEAELSYLTCFVFGGKFRPNAAEPVGEIR